MSTLYLVATPIGNLEDITLRALRVLREVSLIAAEDTRVTGRLLHHYDIDTPQSSFHDFSDEAELEHVLQALAGGDVALVSDAGSPGLSDPGFRLVRAAVEAGHAVQPIPGPTAAAAALIASGLPTDRFFFMGFLPRQQGARRAALEEVALLEATLVLYESPHRLLGLLADVEAVLGDRPVAVARELTKLHEEIWRGSVRAARNAFAARERIRGEITVIIGGAPPDAGRWSTERVRNAMAAELARGTRRKKAAGLVAERAGWRKKEVYDLSVAEGL
jgi:16S rRNA (cytidine1402-2'-O)-methyltransferase